MEGDFRRSERPIYDSLLIAAALKASCHTLFRRHASRTNDRKSHDPQPLPLSPPYAILRTTLAGSVKSARIRSNTPPTARPTIRNGSSISHTRGYSTKASRAKGQHTSRSKHHSRNAIIFEVTKKADRRFEEDGAGDGIRTRDINLGKVALYQLSYSRAPENFIVPPS